ncbi:MAG: diacylglycerol kinase family protein [Bacteroidota bacterium]
MKEAPTSESNGVLTYLKGRVKSFGYAFKGIWLLFSTQPNAKIHLVATAIIGLMGLQLGLSAIEWCFIIGCIALVLTVEAINTALEFLVDLVSPEYHELAGKAKDVAAAAVLLSVICCAVIWAIIYLPKIWMQWL